MTILSNQGGGEFRGLAGHRASGARRHADIDRGGQLRHRQRRPGRDRLELHDVVDILQGNGDGTFSLASSITVGRHPVARSSRATSAPARSSLAVADATPTMSRCSWATATGRFSPRVTLRDRIIAESHSWPAIFNGDGRLDLATANSYRLQATSSVLLGKGDGTFEDADRQPGRLCPAAVATGDFTGNGNLGMAVVNYGSDTVTILPGNGDGTFQQPLDRRVAAEEPPRRRSWRPTSTATAAPTWPSPSISNCRRMVRSDPAGKR